MNLRVISDLFSGLPNPQWQLGVEQSVAMISLVSGLSAAQPNEMPPLPDLGYRGFEISGFGGSCDTYRVYRGYLDACGAILRDPQHRTELWLLETGSEVLGPGLYSELLAEIAKNS